MAFRSSSSLAGASGTSAAIPVPAGAAVGDIAVVGIYKENAAAVTAPAGFTQKSALTTSATTQGALHVFWKRLTAADTGSYSFTWTGSAWRAGACVLLSGRAAAGDPFDGTPGTAESTAAVTTLQVSTSPAAAGGDAVGFWTNFQGGNSYTAPASYTERVDIDVIGAFTRDAVAAGTTGNVSATSNVSGFQRAFLGVVAQAASTVPVTATRATTWNVASSLTSVTATRATSWQVIGRITATRSTTWNVAGLFNFPASVSGRKILDDAGHPWYMVCDHQWNLFCWGGCRDELGVGTTTPLGVFQGYAATQAANGFNAVLILAINSNQNGEVGPFQDGRLWDGVPVWTGGGITASDIGNMNAAYWDRLEDLVGAMAAEGITVVLNVLSAYSIAAGTALEALNATNAATYGTALGNRFKTYPNIIWQIGVDYFGDDDASLDELVNAAQAAGDTHLWTIEYYAESGSRVEAAGASGTFGSDPDINFDDVYTYNASYVEVERSYAYTTGGTRPTVYVNGYYDQGSAGGGTADYQDVADHLGWAITSGSKGHFYGSESTWQWGTGAYAALSTLSFPNGPLGATAAWFTALAGWSDLVPDFDSTLITSARGTKLAAITPSGGSGTPYGTGNDYLTGGVTTDGSLAVLYTPTARTITVNAAELAASYTAEWRDPYSGAATAAASNATSYATPGTNSAGLSNWYLVIQAATTTPVAATRTTSWDTLAPVGATRATSWDARVVVTATRATSWDATAALTASRSTTWDTRVVVAATRATSWVARAAVTASRATSWDVLAGTTSTRSTSWTARAAVTATRATTWNVDGTLATVTASRSTTWDVAAQVVAGRATSWDVHTTATGTRTTTWDTLTAAAATRVTTWDTTASVTATRATSWAVGQTGSVTATRATVWDTRALVAGTAAASWDVLARLAAAATRPTTWDVLTSTSRSRSTTWRALRLVAATRPTSWATESELVLVTPPERTLVVPAESRVLHVPPETRTLEA